METFDFSEALSYLKSGMRVALTLKDKERHYYISNNAIYCVPNNRPFLTYKVKKFELDAVLSEDWRLVQK